MRKTAFQPFFRHILLWLLCVVLSGCGRDVPSSGMSLSVLDFKDATHISLQNCHNGSITIITDAADIAAIAEFVESVTGADPESGKGYYEGSYSITVYRGKEIIETLAFGDSDCFFIGDYGDGYPIRYTMTNKTVSQDVIPFFSQFDQSGFIWP